MAAESRTRDEVDEVAARADLARNALQVVAGAAGKVQSAGCRQRGKSWPACTWPTASVFSKQTQNNQRFATGRHTVYIDNAPVHHVVPARGLWSALLGILQHAVQPQGGVLLLGGACSELIRREQTRNGKQTDAYVEVLNTRSANKFQCANMGTWAEACFCCAPRDLSPMLYRPR